MRRFTDDRAEPDWPRCRRSGKGCRGIAVAGSQECLEHLSKEALRAVLPQLGQGTATLDVRGTRIGSERLGKLLEALPAGRRRRIVRDARFDQATFVGDVSFDRVAFIGPVCFEDAQFGGDAWFQDALFYGDARFQRANFARDAHFEGATFVADARFEDVRIDGDASFDGALFGRDLRLQRARFAGDAWLDLKRFGATRFDDATFIGDVWLHPGQFEELDRELVSGALRLVSAPRPRRPRPPQLQVPVVQETVTDRVKPVPQAPDGTGAARPSVPPTEQAAGGEAPTTPPEPESRDRKAVDLSASTEAMRDSTKWMMGALAAVGAVLVAGLQLGSIGRLDLHNVGVVVSILLVALAALGIGWLIYLASRVLASEYTNLNDAIRDSEKLGKVLPRDWVERDVPRAKTRGMRSLQQISEERDQRYKELSDQPDDELERELEIFDQMVEDAVVVVNHRVAKRTYARLRRWASCVAPLVVLAVVVFALMSGPRGRSAGDPQIMQVVPSDSDRQRYAAMLGTACLGEPIPAAVIPRPRWWFERKKIAALPSARCRGQPRTLTLKGSLRTAAAGGAARPALASFLKPARALQFRLFRPWKEGTAPQAGEIEFGYGFPGDRPLVGDWNGDGTDTIGVHHAKSFYLRNDNTAGGADIVFAYGRPGDTPLVGDWNGDGTDTIGVHRGNRFLLRNSNTPGPPDLVVKFGAPGDTPLVGDWNGDRKDTIGVRVRHSNRFRLRNTNTNTPGRPDLDVEFGKPGGTPLVGDWGGDGKDTIGVRRDGLFYLTTLRPDSKAFSRTHNVRFFRYGQAGDKPLVGDWDADGADDIGVRQGIRECLLKDGACGQQAWQPRTGGVELRSVCALEWPRTPRGHPAVSREQRCVALGLNYEPDPRLQQRSSSRF